ncbi:hypothetical protein KO353_16040 [Elioraea tepida]|uniref:Glycosyltransferase RgtA/B/C/D-like domain-containing protein n=1 Tax=Elioraea tepida TaxID=2843330 RepID=A0A975YJJ5_9PROT|nr:hypothetical protein [Elioraea tepida]QXM24701.1 hypothetical protein KO353_16040 [Elioraea tepida]
MSPLVPALTSPVGLALSMLAASLALRSLSFVPAVIDTDEGLYILQARDWLAGTWPLIGVWDMHPIGAPALVALALMLPLPVIFAVRLLGAVAVAVAGTALFALARVLGLPAVPAYAAGLLSIALTTNFGGLATNTEVLFSPFVVAALALAAREGVRTLDDLQPPRPVRIALAGLLVGIALVIKSVAFFEGCFAFAVMVGPALTKRLLAPPALLRHAALYTAACGAPTLLVGLAYAAQGAFDIFLDVWFVAPFRYLGAAITFRDGAWMLVAVTLFLIWPIVLAAATALPGGEVRRVAGFGLGWLVATTLAIAAPGQFFNHYFLIWQPPLSLLAAAGAWALARRILPARPGLLLAAALGFIAADTWTGDAARRIETGPGFRRADPIRLVAQSLREIVPEGSTVYIANYHPVVYVLSGMAVPTRFAFPQHLAGWYSGVTGIDADAELDRVLAARPAAIVVDRGWWTAMRPPARAAIEATLGRHYEFAARVLEANGPVEIYRLRDPR